MISFNKVVADILAAESDNFYERDPETFFASQIGFCPRQVYLQKLGLTATEGRQGQYRVSTLIQEYLKTSFSEQYERFETEISVAVEENSITVLGRCDLFDPSNEVAYLLKTRNGWYKFNPPIERHLDQLHVYMRGLGVKRGKLVYISKNDLADVREWPAPDSANSYVSFDNVRYDRLITKAQRIRDAIWADGIATRASEIPFQRCGCYFCEEETLAFPRQPDQHLNSASATGESEQEPRDNSAPPSESGPEVSRTEASAPPAVVTGSETTGDHASTTKTLGSERTHVPTDLRTCELWVVWDERTKVARAPWQEGTMYPCEWAETKANPRREYQQARMVADLPVSEIHRAWPFPDGDDLPPDVKPAVLLPHEPSSSPVTCVDFDGVRDPATGHVSDEVADLVDRLGGYAELSQSGRGLHVYVRGGLPAEMDTFAASLADVGSVEIYDHSRFIGGTWRHLKGTPRDQVPKQADVIAKLVAKYR